MKSASRLVAAMLAVAMLAVVLAGCTASNVATVNGEGIPLSELQSQFQRVKNSYPQLLAGPDAKASATEFAKKLLDTLVDQVLVEQAAAKMGVSVSDADVQKQYDQIKSQFKDDAAFQAALVKYGTTPDELKAQIKQQLVLQAVQAKLSKDQTVSPAAIKAYYDKNKSTFMQTASKRVAHILIAANNKALADKVLVQVNSGGDFASLAKQYSIDKTSAAKGGDLGWPTYPLLFQAAVDKLTTPGQVVLVQSTDGWHIIKLEATRAAKQQTLAEASDRIRQALVQQGQADAYQAFIAKLRKDAKIEIDENAIASLVAAVGSTTATASTNATK